MRVFLIAFLALLNIAQSQVVKWDRFNDFTLRDDANVKGHWIFTDSYNGYTTLQDHSGNSNDLSSSGFTGGISASLIDSSLVIKDGKSLRFDGVDDYLYIPALSATDFNPGTGNFTIEIWTKTPTNTTTAFRILTKRPASTEGYSCIVNGATISMFIGDGTNYIQPSASHGQTPNTFHYFAWVVDRTAGTLKFYVDGALLATKDISIVTGSVAPNDDFDIGTNASRSSFYPGAISEIRYSNIARTDNEIKESYNLSKSWYSNNYSVSRQYNMWEQGIVADTIYTAIPNYTTPANRHAILSFDAYGASGGETILTWLTGWNGHFSQTVSTKKIRYEVDLGAMSFSSDSLYFAVPSGTVYIDNVKIEYRRKTWEKRFNRF